MHLRRLVRPSVRSAPNCWGRLNKLSIHLPASKPFALLVRLLYYAAPSYEQRALYTGSQLVCYSAFGYRLLQYNASAHHELKLIAAYSTTQHRRVDQSAIDNPPSPCTPATMSKHHCRMLQVECCFGKIELCFDIIVGVDRA